MRRSIFTMSLCRSRRKTRISTFLRYKILRAQRAPIEQQIEALEEYKKSNILKSGHMNWRKLYQEKPV